MLDQEQYSSSILTGSETQPQYWLSFNTMSINKARFGCGTGVGHNISGMCVAGTCCVLHLGLAAGTDKFWVAQPEYSTLSLAQAAPTSCNLAITLGERVNVCYRARGNVIDKFYDTQMTIGHT